MLNLRSASKLLSARSLAFPLGEEAGEEAGARDQALLLAPWPLAVRRRITAHTRLEADRHPRVQWTHTTPPLAVHCRFLTYNCNISQSANQSPLTIYSSAKQIKSKYIFHYYLHTFITVITTRLSVYLYVNSYFLQK